MELSDLLKRVPADELAKALEAAGMTAGVLYPAQASSLVTSTVRPSVKALPDGAREEFLSVMNSAKASGASETDAYRQAWSKVKQKWERQSNGTWAEKSLATLPEYKVGGPMVGELDHLIRELITDGYEEVADKLTGDTASDLTALEGLPEEYRETIQARYANVRKSAPVQDDEEEFELTTTFKALVNEQRVTYGVVYPVYDPSKGEGDLQKEWAKPAIIEKAAHSFLEQWRQQDTYHTEKSGAGAPVESFIAPCDIHEFHGKELAEPIRAGSWVMATRWTPDAWALVKSGKLTGYSIGGFKKIRR